MDLKKVWENVLLETQGTVSAMTYDNWLSKTEAVCIADDELLVSADSDVTVNVVETRYTELPMPSAPWSAAAPSSRPGGARCAGSGPCPTCGRWAGSSICICQP